MLLRYSLSRTAEADCVEQAVDAVLKDGWRTADILGGSEGRALSCTEMTEKVLERI
jgi:3-isopropylmalate dehydrogenase